MSPLGQVIQSPPPEWIQDMQFPVHTGISIGDAADPDHFFPGLRVADATAPQTVTSGNNDSTAGVTNDYQMHREWLALRMRSTGGTAAQMGFRFGWWAPAWEGSELGPGRAQDPYVLVFILDWWVAFENAASSYADGTTGLFLQASNASNGLTGVPAGASPITSCGFEAIGDGGGGQTLAYGAWNGAGTRLESVQPSSFTPQNWNLARLQVTGGRDQQSASLSAWINGEALVTGRAFGSAQLLRPDQLDATQPKNFRPRIYAEAGSAADMFSRLRHRVGIFDADGVEVGG